MFVDVGIDFVDLIGKERMFTYIYIYERVFEICLFMTELICPDVILHS